MFPQFTGSDTTEDTNSEKRPLITYYSKESDKQTFTHTHALLPSKSWWIFDWFFGCAVPVLDPSAIKRYIVNCTDQDDKEYGAFCAQTVEGKPFPKSSYILCGWHKQTSCHTTLESLAVSKQRENGKFCKEIWIIYIRNFWLNKLQEQELLRRLQEPYLGVWACPRMTGDTDTNDKRHHGVLAKRKNHKKLAIILTLNTLLLLIIYYLLRFVSDLSSSDFNQRATWSDFNQRL